MKVATTPAFVAFAQAAAENCNATNKQILFLSYTFVETSASKGYRWVLNVVNRADFPRTPIMIVNDWEMFYQPELQEQLKGSVLDFEGNQIIVRSNPTGIE